MKNKEFKAKYEESASNLEFLYFSDFIASSSETEFPTTKEKVRKIKEKQAEKNISSPVNRES